MGIAIDKGAFPSSWSHGKPECAHKLSNEPTFSNEVYAVLPDPICPSPVLCSVHQLPTLKEDPSGSLGRWK